MKLKYFIKNFSIVDSSFIHGKNLKMGYFNVIGKNVIVGDYVEVGSNCIIDDHTMLGSYSKLGNYAKIGKNVDIGHNCSFTCFCEIRDNCILGSYVSMGSRCTLSAGTIVGNQVIIKYGFVAADTPNLYRNEKRTVIMNSGSKYGANVTLMPGVYVGENSEIGACSQVRHNVPPNEVWYGNPAKKFK